MSALEDLEAIDAFLRKQGVTGPVKVAGVEYTIAAPIVPVDKVAAARSAKKEYDTMLFAATEGIPDEVET